MLTYRDSKWISAEVSLTSASALQRLSFVLAFVIACSTGAPAQTQSSATQPAEPAEPSLEDLLKMPIPVVEAASKYVQKTTEAPASVTIVTADEVKKHGYRTLADILASAPGLYLTYDRSYSYLGMRGFNVGDFYTRNSRVLLLLDGHRLNNSLTDGAAIGTDFLLDPDLVDRVEIIRGPGSSLYGNNAFFGVINVISRKGRDFTGNGIEASAEAGSLDSYKGRLTYGRQFTNGLEVLLSATAYHSEGHDRLYDAVYDDRINLANNFLASNNGIAEDCDKESFKSGFGRISFRDFSLEGGYITRQRGNPTALFLTDYNDPSSRSTDNRGYVNLKFAHDFPKAVDVTAQIYYDRLDFNMIDPYVNQGGVQLKDSQVGEWWGAELQLTKRLWDRLTLTLGGEYRDDFHQKEEFLDAWTSLPTRPAIEQTRQSHAVYFQGDLAAVTNLHLSAGIRYDQCGDFDPSFNPRLALIYNPFGQSVFKAIYGTAFRAPNFFELSDVRFAANLKPETITTYELVYEQGIGNHLRSSVSGFYNQIDDLIAFSNGRYQNLSGAEAKGIELSLDASWASGVRGRISYALQRAENRLTGERLLNSPQHVGKLNLSVPLWKDKIFAGLEFQYLSGRSTALLNWTQQGWIEQAGQDAGGYGIVNFTLFSQNLVKGLDLSVSVYNLLDTSYNDPSTPYHVQDRIAQDGRSFRVKLTYRF